jgi:hypothetical protein
MSPGGESAVVRGTNLASPLLRPSIPRAPASDSTAEPERIGLRNIRTVELGGLRAFPTKQAGSA